MIVYFTPMFGDEIIVQKKKGRVKQKGRKEKQVSGRLVWVRGRSHAGDRTGGFVQDRQDVGRPSLGEVAQQDEAVSSASHERAPYGTKSKARRGKGPRHGKRHVASLNHGDRSMTGPACGAIN